MTLRQIDKEFVEKIVALMADYDDNGELRPESAAKIKELSQVDDSNRGWKYDGYVRAAQRQQAIIDADDAMIEQCQSAKSSAIKSLEFFEKCIFDSMKLRGETKVETATGIPISISKSGKRGIDYSLLDLMLKSDYTKIPSKFIRKTETIALAKDYIQQEAKAICDDPDDAEKNRLLQEQLGVSYLPAKETLKIGKRKKKGNSDE